MNKRILYLALLTVLALMAYPFAPVFAQLNATRYGPIFSITDLVPSIEGAIWIIFGTLTVVFFVIAGILFLTAQGAPEKLKIARSAFIWGVVGVIVAIVAYSIIAIVSSMLTH